MNPSGSLIFPFAFDNENDCLKRAYTVEDTLLSAIRIFLLTRKGSRLGSNIGSFLPELSMQLIPKEQLPSLADELRTELITNFPGVQFMDITFSKDIENNVSELVVKISFTTANQNNITEFIQTMPTVFDPSYNFQAQL